MTKQLVSRQILELVEALRLSTAQLRDLATGYAHSELHESLEETLERNDILLQQFGIEVEE